MIMSKRILVIDDERSVRDAFELALFDEPYVVDTAENGKLGLEKAKENRPDLVLLDLKMPEMNGVETLRQLKALDTTIQVQIVTAFHKEFMDELKEASADGLTFDLASKPLSPNQIRAIVKAKVSS